MSIQTNGIIIGEKESGEADKILTIYTKDFGKVRLRAKGARKIQSKLAGHLNLFSYSEIYWVAGKKNNIIIDARILDNFYGIKSDSERLKTAFYLSGIIDNLITESEKDSRIWQVVKWVFKSLDEGKINSEESLFLRFFELKILDYLGYLPDFSSNSLFNFNPKIKKLLFNLSRNFRDPDNNLDKFSPDKADLKELRTVLKRLLNIY